MAQNTNNSNGRIFIGAILIILGSLLFLRNFQLELFNIHLFSWPLFPLLIGIVILVNHKDSFMGLAFIVIGVIGLASKYLDISIKSVFIEYWPFLLIILGIYTIFKHSTGGKDSESEIVEVEDYYIDLFSLFGTKNRIIKANRFLGGKVSSVFGEANVDLRNCKLGEGTRELDTLTLFGSTEIHIPHNWNVIINTTTVFGGFDDLRGSTNLTERNENTLIIKGLVLFGGGEIKA